MLAVRLAVLPHKQACFAALNVWAETFCISSHSIHSFINVNNNINNNNNLINRNVVSRKSLCSSQNTI